MYENRIIYDSVKWPPSRAPDKIYIHRARFIYNKKVQLHYLIQASPFENNCFCAYLLYLLKEAEVCHAYIKKCLTEIWSVCVIFFKWQSGQTFI